MRPLCFNAKGLTESDLHANATLGGTMPFWEWIGDGHGLQLLSLG